MTRFPDGLDLPDELAARRAPWTPIHCGSCGLTDHNGWHDCPQPDAGEDPRADALNLMEVTS